MIPLEFPEPSPPPDENHSSRSFWAVAKTLLIGKPRDLSDRTIFQHLSLVAFLAWVGLGADGLSSSCYGPAEAFHNLGEHRYLAVFLAAATILTVYVISTCYSHIIEEFPSGGGGYLVATKLLGKHAGLVSGCALLVDYVLTIAVSIAAAGDALFGLAPTDAQWLGLAAGDWKLVVETSAILLLVTLNLRGVKESVIVLLPIFLVFLATHAVLIAGAIGLNAHGAGDVVGRVVTEVQADLGANGLGWWGTLAVLLHAYSLGAGTYTGIEAVSNSMPVMREPRVATGKRTMRYMAASLALTAGGLMLAYLLLDIRPAEGKTMNLLLAETFAQESAMAGGWGATFVWTTILSEGALLFVAAQAGFIDGPRVLANMARDSWLPHPLGNLSERLATHNGIVLMGVAALAVLWLTHGNVAALVIMYSINVFLTFSLSMLGMCRHWLSLRGRTPLWRRRLTLFAAGGVMCGAILVVTVVEKFGEGGWKTLGVTGACALLCLAIRRHYLAVADKLRKLDDSLANLPTTGAPNLAPPDPSQPTAVILVGAYGGLGIHTLLGSLRLTPDYFQNVVFASAAVLDTGTFKGATTVDDLRNFTAGILAKYVDLAQRLGLPAESAMGVGVDAVDELARICVEVRKKYPKSVFFSGQLVFQLERWYHTLLHNRTSFALQRRLHWSGVPLMILPTRVG